METRINKGFLRAAMYTLPQKLHLFQFSSWTPGRPLKNAADVLARAAAAAAEAPFAPSRRSLLRLAVAQIG
jgi:hypothetical protein